MNKQGSVLQEEAGMPEINISPLIDMVFILLIFFIVTTVFVEEPGVEIIREQAVASERLPANSILIAVTAANQVIYGGREIGVQGVRPIVTRMIQDDDYPVILQVDRGATAAIVVRVIDQVKIVNQDIRVTISTAEI